MRARSNEDGFTMVTALFTTTILAILVTLMFTQLVHTGNATSQDRNRSTAFDVAEAGIDDAVAQIATNINYTGNSTPKSVVAQGSTIGTYTTTVTIPAGSTSDRVIRSVGIAKSPTGATTTQTRTIVQTITIEPLGGFNYALFAATTINFNNNLTLTGSTYSITPTSTQNLSNITGTVTTPADVTTANNTTINGDIWSGGNVTVSTGTTVTGNVLATGSATVGNNGKVNGDVRAASITNNGTILGQQVLASQPAPVSLALPTFTYNPANYTSPVNISSAAMTTCWSTGVGCPAGVSRTAMHGVYYINDGGVVTGPNQQTTVNGDFYIITNGRLSLTGTINTATSSNYKVVFVSTSTSTSPAAISWTNQTVLPANISLLVFSTGAVAFLNQKSFHGMVYGYTISTDQNMTIVWDPSLKDLVGFSWTVGSGGVAGSAGAYNIHPGIWRECEAATC